jgi:LmbE family N-acetylglucosaminyl deacetylase
MKHVFGEAQTAQRSHANRPLKVLVIAPHADDEVIGCGGTMLKYVSEGHEVDLAVAALGTVNRRPSEVKSTAQIRRHELETASQLLGVRSHQVLFEGFENKLDTLPMLDIISRLDSILDEGYDHVFFPCPSHHQDHRVVYDACFAALREGARPNPPSLIAMYEYSYNGWYPGQMPGGHLYVDITEQMEQKQTALSLYRSQLYPAPHPVSVEAIATLAQMRGVECGRPFAELLYLIKMVR